MKAKSHVAIVGHGTAGQAAAVLLAREGYRVEVFERAAAPGPVGAGVLLQPTGLQALWKMGLLSKALQHGAPVTRLYGDTPAGRGVMDMRYCELESRLYGLGMQRGALFQLLAAALPAEVVVHAGTGITEVDCEQGRLVDEHGECHGPFDLVIAADGASSRLRGLVEAPRERIYPWGALWCLVPVEQWPWRHELRQRYLGARHMVGLLPVGTRQDDARPMLSFFWSLPTDAFDAWEARGMAQWRQDVCRIWPEARPCVEAITGSGALSRASYRDAVVRRWHRGRMVLLGDAAHAMSPQLGQGVNMALLDALALRDALSAHSTLDAALHRYQAERAAHVSLYQQVSRWLTPLFQSDRDLLAWARDVAFLPMGRLPGGRERMLRVLTGTQLGYLGALPLERAFMQALPAVAEHA